MTRRRGQLVLVAALALIVALVPLVFAYLQLGYHGDVESTEPAHVSESTRPLDRSLHDAVSTTDGRYAWPNRAAAVGDVRTHLNRAIAELEGSGAARAAVTEISYNRSRATRWAARNCPRGPDRQFGPCEADRGVVVQQRRGETYVLAVAFDVRVTSAAGETRLRTVLAVQTG